MDVSIISLWRAHDSSFEKRVNTTYFIVFILKNLFDCNYTSCAIFFCFINHTKCSFPYCFDNRISASRSLRGRLDIYTIRYKILLNSFLFTIWLCLTLIKYRGHKYSISMAFIKNHRDDKKISFISLFFSKGLSHDFAFS